MLLLVTGASGAGKSTARRLIAPALVEEVECVELGHVVEVPSTPTKVWRHRATEAVVQQAVQLQTQNRHLLLSGDPVAAGEVLAAPPADQLDGLAVCLLDVDETEQTARLTMRGDDPALLVHHVAFAGWMREHARDRSHMPEVLMANGWDGMRWERLTDERFSGTWAMHVIDTSHLTSQRVATEVLSWCRRALAGHAPAIGSRADRPPE